MSDFRFPRDLGHSVPTNKRIDFSKPLVVSTGEVKYMGLCGEFHVVVMPNGSNRLYDDYGYSVINGKRGSRRRLFMREDMERVLAVQDAEALTRVQVPQPVEQIAVQVMDDVLLQAIDQKLMAIGRRLCDLDAKFDRILKALGEVPA